MQDFLGYSSISALSKQIEAITMLQKYSKHLQPLEGAYSAIQQTAQIQKQLAGILNSSSYFDSIKHSAEIQKQFQDTSSVAQAVTSLQGALKTVSSLSSWQKAYFNCISPVKISKIKSVADGIRFRDDEHVELTPDAKEILDSIPDKSIMDDPISDENSLSILAQNESKPSTSDKLDLTETSDSIPISEPESPAPKNVENAPQPAVLSFKRFVILYIEKLIALTNLCLMVIQTVVPDSAIVTPLNDQIVPYVQNISAFCDECRHFFSQNDVNFFKYVVELIDAYDRNTESNKILAESNDNLAESNNRLAEAYERFSNLPTAENNANNY